MMSGCIESEVFERIQAYESIKIKELYTRLITNINILPDFKTRLINLQQEHGEPGKLPGLGKAVRLDGKTQRVAIRGTPGWIEDVSTKDFKAINP
jgi:hypothetical protein